MKIKENQLSLNLIKHDNKEFKEYLKSNYQDTNEYFIKRKKIQYLNLPISFDIETTSFFEKITIKKKKKEYQEDLARGLMYAYVVCFNGFCVVGRTREEFHETINIIKDYFGIDEKRIMYIFVHNLSFEFQWICKRFERQEVFASAKHEVLRAFSNGIEFRCSYRLSGYSLAKVGEHLTKYKINKLVGELDYSLIRTPLTELSEKEWQYIINDGLVVVAFIQEEIEQHGNDITQIELTKTGKVRKLTRNNCFFKSKKNHKSEESNINYSSYRSIISKLKLEEEVYQMLKSAYMGGFTHANALYSDITLENISSYDFTSSYPSVMITEKYPMSEFFKVDLTNFTKEQFELLIRERACIMQVEFENIQATSKYENPISLSKCNFIKDKVVNNGRIVSASVLQITLTEVDFKIIRNFYKWDSIGFIKFYNAYKGYLPIQFIEVMKDLYQKKTTLKGVEGSEVEYMNSKENLNSLYGMCCTDIVRDTISYKNGEWILTKADLTKELEKYNNTKGRFLSYAWGVWISAYARRNLFTGIYEVGEDYVYCDTDSLKIKNLEKHKAYFDNYNESIQEKIKQACFVLGLKEEDFSPKTIKGKIKTIGLRDFEETYSRFKTLGAKRYLVEEKHTQTIKNAIGQTTCEFEIAKIQLTCSGINKNVAVPYLLKKYKNNDNVFKAFSNNLYIPKGKTGKNIHTYIDEETKGIIKDFKGKEYEYHELSSVNITPSDYSLNISLDYLEFIANHRSEIQGLL